MMQGSVVSTAFRAFLRAFFAILGVGCGVLAMVALIGAISSEDKGGKLTSQLTEEILPNSKEVREPLGKEAPVLLQIDLNGIIGTEELNGEKIRQILVESREGDYQSDRVKGLLLYINTPGGTVTDANAIFQAILDYKTKYQVPVYAYVDGLCASGGVYVSLAADKIYASSVSLVGSVGVIAPSFLNVTKLLDKIGVEALTLSAGEGKDALNPLRVWKPGEEDSYKAILDFYYRQFVDLVVAHRPQISQEALVSRYGAKVFPAPLAKEYGYIDEVGMRLQQTVADLARAAKIEEDHYQLIRLADKGWWKGLFRSIQNGTSNRMVHTFSLSPMHDTLFRGEYLYLYTP